MKIFAPLMLTFLVAYPDPASASDKEERIYHEMNSCFTEKANSFDDLTTPLGEVAEAIIGMCWGKVDAYRVDWMNGWGMNWSSFIGPYFTLHVTSKAKEAVYAHRMAKRKSSSESTSPQ